MPSGFCHFVITCIEMVLTGKCCLCHRKACRPLSSGGRFIYQTPFYKFAEIPKGHPTLQICHVHYVENCEKHREVLRMYFKKLDNLIH